jgi:hypothetical protein
LNPLGRVNSRKSPGTSSKVHGEGRPPRVLVVGAGTRFLSAMSYYTLRLTNALALVVGSHGVLDAFAHTTNGVALLWPASRKRLLGPWHVFPSPPASRELFSRRGLSLLGAELLVFAPLWALAARPPGRSPTGMTADLQRDGVAASVRTPATALRSS